MYDQDTLVKIAGWRQKMADGTLTEAEAIEAVQVLRRGNRAAAVGGASRARAAAAPVDVSGLLGELEGL